LVENRKGGADEGVKSLIAFLGLLPRAICSSHGLSPYANTAGLSIREQMAKSAQSFARTEKAIEEARKLFVGQTWEQNLDFINAWKAAIRRRRMPEPLAAAPVSLLAESDTFHQHTEKATHAKPARTPAPRRPPSIDLGAHILLNSNRSK
jgi:hypothetical protein